MPYHALADIALLLHLAFVLFAILGGLLLIRHPRLIWLHAPAAIWAAAIEIFDLGCPLTGLEKWLLEKSGAGAYQGGFVENYLLPILYPGKLTRGVQLALAAGVILVNFVIYRRIVRRLP